MVRRDINETFLVNHCVPALFGANSHQQTGAKLRELGCTKVIVIHDPVIGRLGIAQKVMDAITKAGIEVVEFGEVCEDPTSTVIDEAAAMAREAGVDGVVGVGGGSSMDAAKAVNVLLGNPGSICDYIGKNRGKKPLLPGCPLVLLPTTSGTSSEVTPNCVVTDMSAGGTKTACASRATFGIVDPTFMVAIPPKVTASTGIDMLAHVTESYIHDWPNWMSEIMGERVVELCFAYLPRAVADGSDMEARTMTAFACLVAGYVFGDSPTHLGHAIADQISNKFHYPHGLGCSLGLLIEVRYGVLTNPGKVRRLARFIGVADDPAESDGVVAERVYEAYAKLIRGVGLPNLKEAGVDEALLDFIIQVLPSTSRFKDKPYNPDWAKVAEAVHVEFDRC
jgi:alcohol dehydrogenase class IV